MTPEKRPRSPPEGADHESINPLPKRLKINDPTSNADPSVATPQVPVANGLWTDEDEAELQAWWAESWRRSSIREADGNGTTLSADVTVWKVSHEVYQRSPYSLLRAMHLVNKSSAHRIERPVFEGDPVWIKNFAMNFQRLICHPFFRENGEGLVRMSLALQFSILCRTDAREPWPMPWPASLTCPILLQLRDEANLSMEGSETIKQRHDRIRNASGGVESPLSNLLLEIGKLRPTALRLERACVTRSPYPVYEATPDDLKRVWTALDQMSPKQTPVEEAYIEWRKSHKGRSYPTRSELPRLMERAALDSARVWFRESKEAEHNAMSGKTDAVNKNKDGGIGQRGDLSEHQAGQQQPHPENQAPPNSRIQSISTRTQGIQTNTTDVEAETESLRQQLKEARAMHRSAQAKADHEGTAREDLQRQLDRAVEKYKDSQAATAYEIKAKEVLRRQLLEAKERYQSVEDKLSKETATKEDLNRQILELQALYEKAQIKTDKERVFGEDMQRQLLEVNEKCQNAQIKADQEIATSQYLNRQLLEAKAMNEKLEEKTRQESTAMKDLQRQLDDHRANSQLALRPPSVGYESVDLSRPASVDRESRNSDNQFTLSDGFTSLAHMAAGIPIARPGRRFFDLLQVATIIPQEICSGGDKIRDFVQTGRLNVWFCLSDVSKKGAGSEAEICPAIPSCPLHRTGGCVLVRVEDDEGTRRLNFRPPAF